MKTLQEQAIELLYKVFNQLDADNEILPNSDLYEEIGRWLSTNDANIKPTVSGGAVSLEDRLNQVSQKCLSKKWHDLEDFQKLILYSMVTVEMDKALNAYAQTHQQKSEEWISRTKGWPKEYGWYLTKRNRHGAIYYVAVIYDNTPDCIMAETGWYDVVAYKFLESLPPFKDLNK